MALEFADVIHTGVFCTEQEARSCERTHHAELAVGALGGKDNTPAGKTRRVFRAYGLPWRDGLWQGIVKDSCELVYLVPAT